MAVQARLDQANIPFLLEGKPLTDMDGTILQIAGRTVVLKQYTLMSQIASTGKWAPWLQANLAGTTGIQRPLGIYVGEEITAAALAAADVVSCPIMRGGAGVVVDEGQLVFDKGDTGADTPCTLADIPTVPTNQALQARALLHMLGIFPKSVYGISMFET